MSVFSPPCPGSSQTTVIVHGWAGARRCQLERLERFYRQLGWQVHVVVPSLKRLVRPKASEKEDRAQLCRLAESGSLGEKIFIHAFSFNGALGLMRFLEEATPYEATNLAGVMLDSAPGLLAAPKFNPFEFARPLARAFVALLNPGTRLWQSLAAAFAHLVAYTWLTGFYRLVRRYHQRYRTALIDRIPADLPILLIYGDADEVTPPAEIERYAEHMRFRGNLVRTACFRGARHVQTLSRHADEYEDLLYEFAVKPTLSTRPATRKTKKPVVNMPAQTRRFTQDLNQSRG